ncbi:hypothetical protein WOLCODRAFT_153563 [Wolfiporia cocos MD-104 SS10]|uniref:Uncharacterized protein n=1 Tax=Wolfiporia cocos (strain MD-104) TaxID=742152 RepID=A0A2H3JNN7_WOLCO|nr:hypothetical protein WOLCODRAFT_153563 [Wolfiporia cocos MD-104 SS10]
MPRNKRPATKGSRIVFYQLYTKGGRRMGARNNVRAELEDGYPPGYKPDERDLYLGTLESAELASTDANVPHTCTAGAFKQLICAKERLDPKFVHVYVRFLVGAPLGDAEPIDLGLNGAGLTADVPLALMMRSHHRARRPGRMDDMVCALPPISADFRKRLRTKYTHNAQFAGFLSYTAGEVLVTDGTLGWDGAPTCYMARNKEGEEGYISFYSAELLK